MHARRMFDITLHGTKYNAKRVETAQCCSNHVQHRTVLLFHTQSLLKGRPVLTKSFSTILIHPTASLLFTSAGLCSTACSYHYRRYPLTLYCGCCEQGLQQSWMHHRTHCLHRHKKVSTCLNVVTHFACTVLLY